MAVVRKLNDVCRANKKQKIHYFLTRANDCKDETDRMKVRRCVRSKPLCARAHASTVHGAGDGAAVAEPQPLRPGPYVCRARLLRLRCR